MRTTLFERIDTRSGTAQFTARDRPSRLQILRFAALHQRATHRAIAHPEKSHDFSLEQ